MLSCSGKPLTDRILHYDTLDYNAQVIKDHHEILKRSTTSISANKHIFVSFYALDRLVLYVVETIIMCVYTCTFVFQ